MAAVPLGLTGANPVTDASSYQRISGEGSSWSANAIDAMRVNVQQFGITVDYNATGSTAGRKNFLNGTVDFAASDIPFQFEPEDGSAPENPAPGSYAYMPVTAGGTAFMYNLLIGGKRVTNLRLSGENVSKIFTGAITSWDDPAIKADNPGLVMPARKIVPVVRSDGSGSTAQFTAWMIDRHPAIWNDYCARSGRAPKCGFTSFYPTISGMIAQSGDIGVAGYVSQGFAEGAIGYVNYSYALGSQFPVVKMLNAAGYYVEPTPHQHRREQPRHVPHPGPARRLHRQRPAQLSVVELLVSDPAHQDRWPVQRGQGPNARGLCLLRHVPGPTAVGIARLLADAREPGRGKLRADPQDPRCGGAGHQHRQLQQPDVLGRWHERARSDSPGPEGLRPAGERLAVPGRHRGPGRCAHGSRDSAAPYTDHGTGRWWRWRHNCVDPAERRWWWLHGDDRRWLGHHDCRRQRDRRR
jgi:ABC-type phosphate transport system substrate-binding protein